MKTFKELKESLDRKPSGQKVFDTKIKGTKVLIHKEASGFVVYLDGDRLDAYKDLNSAKKAATEFVNMNEEVEELDELSKKTLGSYVKKSSQQFADRQSEKDATRVGPGTFKDKYDHIKGLNKTLAKRKAGMNKAIDKLTKEEVEELDELSKQKIQQYKNKADDQRRKWEKDQLTKGKSDVSDKQYIKRSKGVQSAQHRLTTIGPNIMQGTGDKRHKKIKNIHKIYDKG